MAKYKVSVTDECIACNACIAICEDNFEMNEDNTKARPKKKTIDDSELSKNEEAKDVCPTNAIKIEKQ